MRHFNGVSLNKFPAANAYYGTYAYIRDYNIQLMNNISLCHDDVITWKR